MNKEPRLRFTDEERADPALEKPIRKADKAAAKADKAQAKIPKKQVRQKTVDPETGSKSLNQEPLRTLATYRRTPAGVIFGQNVIAENSGELVPGMSISILE